MSGITDPRRQAVPLAAQRFLPVASTATAHAGKLRTAAAKRQAHQVVALQASGAPDILRHVQLPGRQRKKASEVFGISNTVLLDSYVDRGELDEELAKHLSRQVHIALRGESKCGKTWLRERVLPNALVVQCRLGKSCLEIYKDALNKLDVRLEVESQTGSDIKGSVEARGDFGINLLAKVGLTTRLESGSQEQTRTAPVTGDVVHLIGQFLLAGERRLVIEDFHYLSISERRKFAFDMKAFWDAGVFLIVVGVWSGQNMLQYLNRDLTARVREFSVVWTDRDLRRVFERGGEALGVEFGDDLQTKAVKDSYGNVGILQTLILGTLDEVGIEEAQNPTRTVDDLGALETTAIYHAEQLEPVYREFAERVSGGMRTRSDSTGIYAHAMAVILRAEDDTLLSGITLDEIFQSAHERQPRIQKQNLDTILKKFEELQVDDAGRGLILAYNDALKKVAVVDRQLLLYRKYSTVAWPWEDIIREVENDTT